MPVNAETIQSSQIGGLGTSPVTRSGVDLLDGSSASLNSSKSRQFVVRDLERSQFLQSPFGAQSWTIALGGFELS